MLVALWGSHGCSTEDQVQGICSVRRALFENGAGGHRSGISYRSARDGRRMAEIGGHSSAFFQTPANTNEIMRAAPVGCLYCSSSSLTVHVFMLFGTPTASVTLPKLTKLPSDLGKVGAFANRAAQGRSAPLFAGRGSSSKPRNIFGDPDRLGAIRRIKKPISAHPQAPGRGR
jgi:hypothetical protein